MTASMKARILALAMTDASNDDIAQAVGTSSGVVKTTVSRARKRGQKIPYRGAYEPEPLSGPMPCIYPIRNLRVDRHALQRIRTAAEKRGMKIDEFVGELLTVIARDGMFDAVLDDAPVSRSSVDRRQSPSP